MLNENSNFEQINTDLASDQSLKININDLVEVIGENSELTSISLIIQFMQGFYK